MKKILRLLMAVWVGLPLCLSGQNILPNPSFENTSSYPCSWLTSAGQFNGAMTGWSMPSNGSTDIFSTVVSTTCYSHAMSTHGSSPGNQMPRTGNVMCAILTYGAGCGYQPNYREYIQAQTTSTMLAGQSYDIEFWVSLGDRSQYATNNLGAHFRTNSYFQGTCFTLNLPAQFNHTSPVTNANGWERISGTVTATANWNYILIGNFFSNAATTTAFHGGPRSNTRYFIDDVTLQEAVVLPSAEIVAAGQREADGSIALTWEMTGNSEVQEFKVQRSSDGGLNWNTVTVGTSELRYHTDLFPPVGALQYRVRYRDANGGDFASETIQIAPGSFPYRVEIAPHPVNAGQPLVLRVAHGDATPVDMEVFDVQGRRIWKSPGHQMQDLEGFRTDHGFEPGVYILKLTTGKGVWTRKFLVRDAY